MRCGYGLAHPDILANLKKFGAGPGAIGPVGYGAVLGSLDDPEHVDRSRAYVRETRKVYENQIADMGLTSVSGPTPFILVELGDRSRPVFEELKRRNVFTSHGDSWHLPDYIRISYGHEHENQAFFSAMNAIL